MLIALCFAGGGRAFAYHGRPHLFFLEGSLGGTDAAALDREGDAVAEQGSFYWGYNGNFYKYKPSRLTLTFGAGYEYLALSWLGFRALYSYTSHLHLMTASTGSGRYSRSSSLGGQVAGTDGFFIGPVFRYALWTGRLVLEFPLQWGMHWGKYTPLRSYTEIREIRNDIPLRSEEYTTQVFQLHKLRYGIGMAYLPPESRPYISLTFYVEQGTAQTAVGPQPASPVGSAWNSYLFTLAAGLRL